MQLYIFGRGSPIWPLRRYVLLLGADATHLSLLERLWCCPALTACVEPLPGFPRPRIVDECARRLYLIYLVTETTRYAALAARSELERGWGRAFAGVAVAVILEFIAVPFRVITQAALLLQERVCISTR